MSGRVEHRMRDEETCVARPIVVGVRAASGRKWRMKKRRMNEQRIKKHVAFVFAALLFTLALSATGWAATRMGVIDLALIMDESKAGKRVNALLADFVSEKREEL